MMQSNPPCAWSRGSLVGVDFCSNGVHSFYLHLLFFFFFFSFFFSSSLQVTHDFGREQLYTASGYLVTCVFSSLDEMFSQANAIKARRKQKEMKTKIKACFKRFRFTGACGQKYFVRVHGLLSYFSRSAAFVPVFLMLLLVFLFLSVFLILPHCRNGCRKRRG